MRIFQKAGAVLLAACLLHASVASAAMSAKPVKAFVPALIPPTDIFVPRFENHSAYQLFARTEEPSLLLSANPVPISPLGVPADRQWLIAKTREAITTALNDRASENLLASFAWDRLVENQARALISHLASSGAISFATPQEQEAVIAELSRPGTDHLNMFHGSRLSVMDRLTDCAKIAARTRFNLETVERAKLAHRLLLPEFFHDIQPLRTKEYGQTAAELLPGGAGRILLEPDNATYQNERTEGSPLFTGPQIQHRIRRLIMGVHEYAHLLFDQAVRDEDGTPPPASLGTAYASLSEGFAVMLELLADDRAAAHPDKLGLSAKDAKDLEIGMASRTRYLKLAKNHYTEGWLNFWLPIYEKSGTRGMADFLHRLYPEKLLGLSRASPQYDDLLRDPRRFQALTLSSSRRRP